MVTVKSLNTTSFQIRQDTTTLAKTWAGKSIQLKHLIWITPP